MNSVMKSAAMKTDTDSPGTTKSATKMVAHCK